jgi:histidine triad (HIT) family protein
VNGYIGAEINRSMPKKTLFERIAERQIPAEIIYEDEHSICIRDIDPMAPVHVLIIPRKPIPSLDDLTEEDTPLVGHLFQVARRVASDLGLVNGYRTVFNCGEDASQSVPHLHLHLLGGRKFSWPPG